MAGLFHLSSPDLRDTLVTMGAYPVHTVVFSSLLSSYQPMLVYLHPDTHIPNL